MARNPDPAHFFLTHPPHPLGGSTSSTAPVPSTAGAAPQQVPPDASDSDTGSYSSSIDIFFPVEGNAALGKPRLCLQLVGPGMPRAAFSTAFDSFQEVSITQRRNSTESLIRSIAWAGFLGWLLIWADFEHIDSRGHKWCRSLLRTAHLQGIHVAFLFPA